jgi:hypothetical protein
MYVLVIASFFISCCNRRKGVVVATVSIILLITSLPVIIRCALTLLFSVFASHAPEIFAHNISHPILPPVAPDHVTDDLRDLFTVEIIYAILTLVLLMAILFPLLVFVVLKVSSIVPIITIAILLFLSITRAYTQIPDVLPGFPKLPVPSLDPKYFEWMCVVFVAIYPVVWLISFCLSACGNTSRKNIPARERQASHTFNYTLDVTVLFFSFILAGMFFVNAIIIVHDTPITKYKNVTEYTSKCQLPMDTHIQPPTDTWIDCPSFIATVRLFYQCTDTLSSNYSAVCNDYRNETANIIVVGLEDIMQTQCSLILSVSHSPVTFANSVCQLD